MNTSTKRKFHPDGVAALVAVILAPEDVESARLRGVVKTQAYRRAVDFRRDQILRLARAHYAVYAQDFEDAVGWQASRPRNGLNNLAKLDRSNLLR